MQKYRVTIIMSTSRLSLFFFYAILIFLVNNPTINAQRDPYVLHQCSTTGNVTSNSTFRANLNTLISTLSSNTQIDYGFYNFTAGEGTNKVYATGLCRADLSPTDCRSCVNMSAHELLQLCPTQKEGVMWYMNCTARYSNNSIFGVVELKPTRALVSGLVLLTKVNEALKAVLFDDLRVRASAGSIFGKVAVGIANYNIRNSTDTIYGLMQCSPDLSENDCSNCLVGAQSYFQACCSESVGVRILAPSCNLRIESEQFYDSTLGESPTSLSPPSPAKSISPPPAPAKSISPPPAPAKSISPPPLVPSKEKKSNSSKAIIIIVVAVVVFTMLIICICVSLRVKKQRKNVQTVDEISKTESLQFNFSTIRVATDNFSDANKLGKGGFGFVYQGRLSDGQEIAVKRLSRNSGQGDLEFKNEILIVAKLQHRNLVKLRGFCFEGIERLLIYDFVPNGSLDQFIFDTTKRANLDWQMRYEIIVGIARGLLYLHEDSRLRIIHRDLKPSNILLDAEMNPKIADFGLARLVLLNQTQSNTNRIVGTYGYMAPEYASYGHFSVKSDVFSFGVLVLEIVCGEKNGYFRNSGEYLLNYAWKNWRNMTTSNIIDPILEVGSTTEIIRCIHIGLLCVQENVADRPTMASIIQMLNSNSITLLVPSRPAFFIHNDVEPNKESNQSLLASTNESSITELYPR
ncbi:cysteine-rich receptor-like protein kinase 29 isoform X3 [Quercus robur]|uniref:cysteine-rich receptor-like protein kinase 29 isoform X3 n=1 Tax=Quercus robur TaxID=38942 RepID=UPI002162C136|nr:cysteine-rich receptor-like protein kinase 29 isoform X3 [Quercus robur]